MVVLVYRVPFYTGQVTKRGFFWFSPNRLLFSAVHLHKCPTVTYSMDNIISVPIILLKRVTILYEVDQCFLICNLIEWVKFWLGEITPTHQPQFNLLFNKVIIDYILTGVVNIFHSILNSFKIVQGRLPLESYWACLETMKKLAMRVYNFSELIISS